MNIAEIIDGFKKTSRYSENPTFTAHQLQKWTEEFEFQFPTDFKTAVTGGKYDKETFHFIQPFKDESERFLIFAEWNKEYFGFPVDGTATNPEVYVIFKGMKPEKKFKNFLEWFTLVYEMSIRPANPE